MADGRSNDFYDDHFADVYLERSNIGNNEELRQHIYGGGILRLSALPQSLALVDKVNGQLNNLFNVSPRHVHESLSYNETLKKISTLRTEMAESIEYRDLLRALVCAADFKPAENALDVFRLRSVFHDGHKSEGSARAYALHRDTWFGNPQSQINWWIPLHDVNERDSFAFYPEYFDAPIENTSSQFDYNEWMNVVGWQGMKGGTYSQYPAAIHEPPRRAGFTAQAGDILLFSAAHLHGTVRNTAGLTRWSIDFRTVHLGDFQRDIGAPNADNGSQPLALNDYIQPGT